MSKLNRWAHKYHEWSAVAVPLALFNTYVVTTLSLGKEVTPWFTHHPSVLVLMMVLGYVLQIGLMVLYPVIRWQIVVPQTVAKRRWIIFDVGRFVCATVAMNVAGLEGAILLAGYVYPGPFPFWCTVAMLPLLLVLVVAERVQAGRVDAADFD